MLCIDNNVVLILNFSSCQALIQTLQYSSFLLSMKIGFNKVQENISREETVNIKTFTG